MPRFPLTELLSQHRALLHPRFQAPVAPVPVADEGDDRLARFFDRLDECDDKGALTHGLHPYPAKFIPHIPRELIAALSQPGDLVWDPMCGSGTTLVEAALSGRDAIGSDINPIALLASSAKTTPLDGAAVDELSGLLLQLRVEASLWPSGRPGARPPIPDFHNRDHWFEPQVSHELGLILEAVEGIRSEAARRLARCAFSAILVAASNQEGETRWRAVRRPAEPGSVRLRFLAKLRAAMFSVQIYGRLARGQVVIARHDVLDEPDFGPRAEAHRGAAFDRPVDLVVTSPPYANAHDYYLYNKLRMYWLGEDVRSVQEAEIGSRHRHSDKGEGIDEYLACMQAGLERMRSRLAAGGRVAMVIADGLIRGRLHPMDRLMPEVAAAAGLEVERTYSFDHRRFNTGLHNGFSGAGRDEKLTHVLVMR